jgi:hypothetical protein
MWWHRTDPEEAIPNPQHRVPGIRRIRGKCLSVYEEYANLGFFAVHKIVPEYAERIYANMEKTPRDTILFIKKILSIYTLWDGLSLKTISCYYLFNS